MKKIFLSIAVLFFLLLHTPTVSAKCFDVEGEYTFYSTSYYADENCTVLQNGNMYHVTCDSEYASKLKGKLDDIVGESVSVQGDKRVFEDLCRKFGKVLFCYTVDDVVIAEGYSQDLLQCVTKQGKKVNFQVAFDGKTVTAGTPTILGGF